MPRPLRAISIDDDPVHPRLELSDDTGAAVVVAPLSNPLDPRSDTPDPAPPAAGSLEARWTGWLDAECDPGRSVFQPAFRTWGQPGLDAFNAWLDSALQAHDHDRPLLLRPHARHVLSDPQRVLNLFRSREGAPMKLLLEPAAFLTPEMVADAPDHLRRAFEALLPQRWTWGTLLTGVRNAEASWGTELEPCPITEGRLDSAGLIELFHASSGLSKPLALLDAGFEDQLRLVTDAASASTGMPAP